MSSIRWSVVPALFLLACSSNPPPNDAGVHTSSVEQADTVSVPASAAVLTQHNDMARTGRQLAETVLNPTTVGGNFGRSYYLALDARAYAQPLYVPGLTVTKTDGSHVFANVVFVATENNSIYAFDADNYNGGAPLWMKNFNGLDTAVPSADLVPGPGLCVDIPGTVGITGTPVIDPVTQRMYFVTATKHSSTSYAQTIHAIDIQTGNPLDSAVIAASWPGSFNPGFDAKKANQRAGLLLAGGKVWVGFASHCSDGKDGAFKYSGWMMAFDAAHLTTPPITLDTGPYDDTVHTAGPNLQLVHGGAGVWMGGTGPASDGTHVWVATGNGYNRDPTHAIAGNYADSVLRLGLPASGSTLTLDDWFVPAGPTDQETLYEADKDVSADGVVLLPPDDFSGTGHAQLAVAANKLGEVYVLDANVLGHFTTALVSPGHVVGGDTFQNQRNYGAPGYYGSSLYYAANGDSLRKFQLGATSLTWPTTSLTGSQGAYGYPGATPSISAAGAADPGAIVWTVNRPGDIGSQSGQGTLYANYASTLGLIYSSSQKFNGHDNPSRPLQFQAPTIAGGHVFVAGGSFVPATPDAGTLTVYGLQLVAPATARVTQGQTVAIRLTSPARTDTGLARTTTLTAPAVTGSGAVVTLGGTTLTTDATVTATFDATNAAPGTYIVTFGGTMADGSLHQTYTTSTTVTVDPGPPTAAFTPTCSGWQCRLDASASTGANLSYAWTFGNGGTSSAGPTTDVHYHGDNTYTVTLTVTNAGGTATVSHAVTVSDPPPIASFTWSCQGRACTFNGTSSSDVPGPIAQMGWQFGDSRTASGGIVNHTYGVDGNYLVNLTVVDREGQQSHQTQSVHAVDHPPLAALSVGCVNRVCTANASGSSDDLGISGSTILWGDGTTSSGAGVPSAAQHTYAADGSYVVQLSVTDTAGQTTFTQQSVTVQWVLAAHYQQKGFVYPAQFDLEEDATASSGPNPIVSYHWVWPDGTVEDTAVASAASWQQTGDGPTLTVTDSAGGTATTSAPDSTTWVFKGGPIGPPVDPPVLQDHRGAR